MIKYSFNKNTYKKTTFKFISLVLSIFVATILIEIILRIVPLPGIEMGHYVYDPGMKLFKHKPNTTFVRTNIRNERIIRSINSEGFMDKNHQKAKPEKNYRVGFFGDSYVEARQVPLEKTFFQIIEDSLSEKNVETLGFGKSGHGPVHSYLISKKYSNYYDLDMIIYVFCENDLGDQIESIKKSSYLPYVEFNNNNLVINSRKLSEEVEKQSIKKKILNSFVYSNSIFFQTLIRRISMLWKYGIKINVNENDFTLSGRGEINQIPSQNDLPSTWNPNYKTKAIQLGEAVIKKWFIETKLDGREFAVLYIPRSSQWKKDDIAQDSWKYWLRNYCNNMSIDFIDPTNNFYKLEKSGKKIYDDHFSEDGHVAFANAFIKWYNKE